MDRRRLLSIGISSALTLVFSRLSGTSAATPGEITLGHPLVYDLEPNADVPRAYPDALTAEERWEMLKMCGGRKAQADCFPILEGEVSKTTRTFETYSLFLISNPSWLGPNSDAQLIGLYEAYEGFARAIGKKHAAVFFWKKAPKKAGGKLEGANLAAQLDANRCTEYEKTLNLQISASPHILVTRTPPNPNGPLGEYILIELGDLSAASTVILLTKLADQLVNSALNQQDLDSAKWWLTWRDVAVSFYLAFASLVKHSKLKIKGGPVELELDGK